MAEKNIVYTAVLIDIEAQEIREGFVSFEIMYELTDSYGESHVLSDRFDGDQFNFKALSFFGFLEENKIPYENFDDLCGLSFEAELHHDSRFNKVLIPKKLKALPLSMR